MRLRRLSAVFVVFLAAVSLASCSGSTTGPSDASADWKGTDLLWDAIGSSTGFTAVGNSGVVVTSQDNGHTWQQQRRVTRQTLRGIASDGSTVVAVGTGGSVVTWSADDPGRAQARKVGRKVTLLGVANGGGTWVVGGSGGTLFTSADLRHWDEHTAGTDGDVFAIAYGAGHFVAVTDIGSIITSTDGTNWTVTRQPDGLWLWGAAFGPDGFLAVGANGAVFQSADGATWTTRTTPTNQVLRGVVYGNGQYLAVGSDATVISSPDGISWTAKKIPTEGVELWRPAAGNSEFLAVGAGGTRLVFTNLGSRSGAHSTRTAFYGVGSDGSMVLAAGVNGTVAERQTGGGWRTVATAPGDREMRSVTDLGSTWVATGGGGTILTSTDGTTFTPRDSGSKAELWSSAQSSTQERIVVVGAGGAILVSDDQGQTWTPAKDPQKETLFSVTEGPHGFVAVGVDGAIVRSADGLTWTTVVAGGAQTLRAVSSGSFAPANALGAAEYVAVGASGTMLTSFDGEHWRTLPAVTLLTLRGVAIVGHMGIVVGGGGITLRSVDATSWKAVPSGTDGELFAVTQESADGCGAIAVAGIDASITTTDCGSSWKLAG